MRVLNVHYPTTSTFTFTIWMGLSLYRGAVIQRRRLLDNHPCQQIGLEHHESTYKAR